MISCAFGCTISYTGRRAGIWTFNLKNIRMEKINTYLYRRLNSHLHMHLGKQLSGPLEYKLDKQLYNQIRAQLDSWLEELLIEQVQIQLNGF